MPTVPHSLFEKNRRVVVSDGTPIAYTELGHGDRTPVVLANGWSCPDVYWADIVPYLVERGHRVILPDTRGHGDSGLPRRPGWRARNITAADMSLERIARDLVEVCDDADVTEPAIFMGHSMGVQTILEVWREEGASRIAGLVAVAGPYENPMKTFFGAGYLDSLFPVARFGVMALPRLLLPAYRWLMNQHTWGHWAAIQMRAAGPKLALDRFTHYLTHLGSRDPLILFKLLDSMRAHSAENVLPSIDVPFLILAGANDWFCPPRSQKRMHELSPGSEIVWFAGGHHTLPLDEPEAVCAAIGEWLDHHSDRFAGPAPQKADAAKRSRGSRRRAG